MADSDTVKLTITEVVYRGRGLARLDGFVVFVPGVLPGETVKARITQRHKNYAEAELVEILEHSASRKQPECPLARQCPGCCYLHSDYEEEIRIKQRQLTGFIEHVCKADAGVCGPPVASPARLGYRNRITLHARSRENGSLPSLGYIGQDNRTVLDIQRCPLAMESLNQLLENLRADEKFMTSLMPAKSVNLRYTKESGACLWTSPHRHGKPDFVSVPTRRLIESTTLGDLETPLTGFFQVNPPVLDQAISHVMQILAESKSEALIDVYCGSGVFAVAGATVGIPHILGIELDSASVKAAVRNVKARNMENVLFLAQSAGRALKSALAEVKAASTAVLADPPRTGLEKPALRAMADSRPRDVIYVSCAADTLARDLNALIAAGYSIQSSRMFDMFPCTSYFESVTHLQQAKH